MKIELNIKQPFTVGTSAIYDDTEIKNLLAGLDTTKANKSEIPSIEGLATELYVTDAIANIEIPDVDLTGFASEEYVDDKVNSIIIPPSYDDSELQTTVANNTQEINTLWQEMGQRIDEGTASAIAEQAIQPVINALYSDMNNKADKSDIPEPYDDFELQLAVAELNENKVDKKDLIFEKNANNGISFGENNKVNDELSVAIGANNTINNALSMAVGENIITNNYCELSVGRYNENKNNILFSIGGGTALNDRMNMFEVNEDGEVYMWVGGNYIAINDILADIIANR